MICETIVGRLETLDTRDKRVEYVEIPWDEAFKRIHRKVTDTGREVGIRMGDFILTRGLYEGDVIYQDDTLVIAVHTPPCQVISIAVEASSSARMIPKVCYEVGNRHAPFFYGEETGTFLTPYNEPMLVMLKKLPGVTAEKKMQKLDFASRISAGGHGHHHHHGTGGHHGDA